MSIRHLVLLLILIVPAAAAAPAPGQNAPLPAQVQKTGAIFRVPDSYTLAVALTADGKLLARGGADNTVDLWDVACGKKPHTLKGHPDRGYSLAFSQDGKTLASAAGGIDPKVKLWTWRPGRRRWKSALTLGPWAFSPDGKTLATGASSVILWDVTTGKERA